MTALSGGDIWVVGGTTDSNGTNHALSVHWTGTGWVAVDTHNGPGASLSGVAAFAGDDVWAVGGYAIGPRAPQTLVDHWNGSVWSNISAPDLSRDDALASVSGTSTTDIWAVGFAGIDLGNGVEVKVPLIEHWNGRAWSVVHAPTGGLDPANHSAVQAVLQNNAAYKSATLAAVHALSPTDVWAVGSVVPGQNSRYDTPDQTFTEHWDGSHWSIVSAPDVASVPELGHAPSDDLLAVDGVSSHDVWAVGSAAPVGTLTIHWDGTRWSLVPSPESGFNGNLSGLTTIHGDDAWAVGDSIARWDGHKWTQTATLNGSALQQMSAVAAVSSNDVWIAELTSFVHYTCTAA